jgi:hypothetical protein
MLRSLCLACALVAGFWIDRSLFHGKYYHQSLAIAGNMAHQSQYKVRELLGSLGK